MQLGNLIPEPEQQEQSDVQATPSTVEEPGAIADETSTAAPDLDTILLELTESYNDEIGRIDKAIAQVGKQKDKILWEAGGLPELEPFLRVKQREADDLMVQGKKEDAALKLDAGDQMKLQHQRLEDAWRDCERQIAELEDERRPAARKVLGEWLPSVLPLIRAQERKLFAMLERIAAEITEFVEMTDPPVWGSNPSAGPAGGINPDEYTRSLVATEGEEGEAREKWYTVTKQVQVFIKERK